MYLLSVSSNFYNIEKNKILKCLDYKECIELSKVFSEYLLNNEKICLNGCKMINALYCTKADKAFEKQEKNAQTEKSLN